MKGRIGGTIGAVVGCLGWMIGFTVVCLVSGETEVWSRFAFTGIAVSLAMALAIVVTIELMLQKFGRGGLFLVVLWGEIALSVGVLLLLLNHWIAPILESSPGMVATLGRLGSAYRTSDLMPALLLTASVLLLGFAAYRLTRGGARPSSGESHD